MNFPVLDHLNTILRLLRGNFITIGLTLAGLVGAVAICKILIDHNNRSGAARNDRWEGLTLVFICVGLLAGLITLIGFAQQIGGGL
jgi:high-affinity Fe2+/Pb2+ permease